MYFLCQQVRMIYQGFDLYKSPFTCHLKSSGSDRIKLKVLNTSDGWDVDSTKVKLFIYNNNNEIEPFDFR